MNRTIPFAALLAAVQLLPAQTGGQVRQASLSGSRGASGRCTIEVRVDNVAEVDVYGNTGRLRTLAGQEASWSRLECTDGLPYNMSEFRLRGVDGRGKVQLAQDPRQNQSTAVIRIEDSKSGAGTYRFELEWEGASGGAPTGGFDTGTDPGGRRRDFPGQGRRSGFRGISAEQAIDVCRSEVRARAERDYNLRSVDITSAAVDPQAGRNNWVSGTFNDRLGRPRRDGGYRFRCSVDENTGQAVTVEILRADGTPLPSAGSSSGSYDQNRVLRACQDAVIARTRQDGYQNAAFSSTAIDTLRSGWVTGRLTAQRGPLSDTIDFSCSIDFSTATVRSVEVNRR